MIATAVTVALLGSVVVHELAHAFVARALGLRVSGVHLWGLGGTTALEEEPPTARAQYLVSVAGPLVNVGLGALSAGVWVSTAQSSGAHEIAARIAGANLFLALYNLLPGLPLDGGQLVRAAVWGWRGDKVSGMRAAGYGGYVVAAATALLAVAESRQGGAYGLVTLFVAAFIAAQARRAVRGAGVARRLPALVAGMLARPAFVVAEDLPLAEALRRAEVAGRASVVFGTAEHPAGVLSEALLATVPTLRRAWVPLSSVLAAPAPLDAALAGEDLLRALNANGQRERIVMSGSKLVGVLRIADVAAVLAGPSPVRSAA